MYLCNDVILDEARRAEEIVRHPMIVAVRSEISVDYVIDKFTEGRFDAGRWWDTLASNYLIRPWFREIFP